MAAENVVKAGDVMTKDIIYIDGGATVKEAVKKMNIKRVYSLIVNARNVDDSFGIVTRKDIVSKIVAQGKDPKAVKVHEIMTKPLITVSPGLSVEYCARLFAKTGIRRAPVFDGKKIVGMINNTSLVRTLMQK